jgi:hypothetical protein
MSQSGRLRITKQFKILDLAPFHIQINRGGESYGNVVVTNCISIREIFLSKPFDYIDQLTYETRKSFELRVKSLYHCTYNCCNVSRTLQMFTGIYGWFIGKSECGDFKFMGIACYPQSL